MLIWYARYDRLGCGTVLANQPAQRCQHFRGCQKAFRCAFVPTCQKMVDAINWAGKSSLVTARRCW